MYAAGYGGEKDMPGIYLTLMSSLVTPKDQGVPLQLLPGQKAHLHPSSPDDCFSMGFASQTAIDHSYLALQLSSTIPLLIVFFGHSLC